MPLLEELPKPLEETLLKEVRREELVAAIATDLNLQGGFGEEWLVITPARIRVYDGNGSGVTEDRTHCGLGKATPSDRVVEPRPSTGAKLLALPRAGGLHVPEVLHERGGERDLRAKMRKRLPGVDRVAASASEGSQGAITDRFGTARAIDTSSCA